MELGKITIVLDIPELGDVAQRLVDAIHELGDRMADNLEPIRVEMAQMRDLFTTIDTEIAQIAAALQRAAQDPAAVQSLAEELRDLRTNLTKKIEDIVPDAATAPPPAPAPGA